MSRRSIRVLIAALVTVLASSALVASPASAASGVYVTGTVSDADGYPLAGVDVQVVRADREDIEFDPSTTGVTGAFGSPKIPYEGKSKYQVRVTDPTGRHQEVYSKAFTATKAHAVQNVTMADAAIIRGKITTKDGTKVRPASVIISARSEDGSEGGDTVSSATGGFSLGGLPSGTYSLLFENTQEDEEPGPFFRTTCYDNVLRRDGVCGGESTVVVKAGQVTTLKPQVMDSRIGELSGKVTDSAKKGLKYVDVSIYDAKDKTHWVGSATTGAKGTWNASVDFSGKVKIVAEDGTGKHRTTWYAKSTSFAKAKALPYNGVKDIDDLKLVLPKARR